MNKDIKTEIAEILITLRESKPLIHHITNYVTVNDCANITLAIGASPIMADDAEEVEDIVSMSSALVLNMGTLNKRTIESMTAAGKKANEMGIPVVFDPVGVGASQLRSRSAGEILEQVKCSVIRGNISEIQYLSGVDANIKGVDASEADKAAERSWGIEIASLTAKKYNCTAAITGAADIISNAAQTICIENGSQMLGDITGTGCMCTSLVGSFCGVGANSLISAAAGILSMGIAGETAFEKAGEKGLGSFHMVIIDEIGKLSKETIYGRAKIYEVKH